MVRARRVHAVLVGDDLPELGADLVTALAALDVNDFAPVVGKKEIHWRQLSSVRLCGGVCARACSLATCAAASAR